MPQYLGTHMHLHTTFEASATMRTQALMAKKLGLDALFITDHDVRMGYLKKRVNAFSFQSDDACQMINGSIASWRTPEDEPIFPVMTAHGWALSLPAERHAQFFVTGKQHQASLLADLTLTLDLLLPDAWQGGLRMDVELSLSPDNEAPQHLYYDLGDCPQEDPRAYRCSLPRQTGKCQISLPISQDILQFESLGQDHCFVTLHLRAFGKMHVMYLGHRMTRKYAAEAVRRRQQALADQIGRAYGVALYVATEISGAGQHKNSFSQSVPVMDYQSLPDPVPWERAAAHVKQYGGITSYNHMFTPWQGKELQGDAREEVIQHLIQYLLDTHAEGADLIEVGFPEGRAGFTAEEYCRVWDQLAMRGLILTGYGDNDCHNTQTVWMDGNNFATFWHAEHLSRAALEKALSTGDAYTLDPVRLAGLKLHFSVSGAPMGGLLIGGNAAVAAITIQALAEPAALRLIIGGVCLIKNMLFPGDHALQFAIGKNAEICPVRMELLGMDGRPLLITNPVYWADQDLPGYAARPRRRNQ